MAQNVAPRLVSAPVARAIVYSLATVYLLAICGMQIAMFDASDFASISWTQAAVIAVLLAITTNIKIQVYIRRQNFTFNAVEIPLVLSFFWIPPLLFALFRLPLILYEEFAPTKGLRRVFLKIYLSFTVIYVEQTLAYFVFRYYSPESVAEVSTWLVIFVSVSAGTLVGAGSITLAINLVQGRMARTEIVNVLYSVIGASVLNPALGIIVLLAVEVNEWAGLLLLIPGFMLVVGYRVYTKSIQQYRIIKGIYQFTQAISQARQDRSLTDALLVRTRELVGAEKATLWLPAQGLYPEVLLVARADSPGVVDDPQGETDPIRLRALEQGVTVTGSTIRSHLPKTEPAIRQTLVDRGDKDVITVPLRSGSAVIGCLEVAGRMVEYSTFLEEDVQLMETIAAHAAVAVENARLLDRLRHDAYHDALTGLPNRRRFLSALEAAIQVRPAPAEVVAVLQFDVDSLRDVNETLGREAGDRLLVEVGQRLQAEAPGGALVARLGGDEFAVLLRAQGTEGVQDQAVALQFGLTQPLQLDNFTLDVGAAVGIALFPEHGSDASVLMQRADVATYAAKHNPRSIQLYRAAMESRSLHRLGLVSELRRAIDEDALTVYYQPKVSLVNRELVGMECLVRWEHPEHGLVSPDDFIPVAEHTGLVGALTQLVLKAALTQGKRWYVERRPIGVAVNLSPRSLLDPDFPAELDNMLKEAGLPAELLTLEITESAMVGDGGRPLPTLQKLHALGVQLSVDDFGTGYSSLSYLRRLPVHEVKIDKSFVLGMATDSGDLGIVRAIVDLGRHLSIQVVAEGVESEMTLTLLEEMGCDVAQGFLFSRPLPYERIEAWMAARTERAAYPTGEGVQRLRVVGS